MMTDQFTLIEMLNAYAKLREEYRGMSFPSLASEKSYEKQSNALSRAIADRLCDFESP